MLKYKAVLVTNQLVVYTGSMPLVTYQSKNKMRVFNDLFSGLVNTVGKIF